MHEYGDICERNGIIMGDEMLASVCELAFDVAKEGSAPSAMKNYLYLAQRPPRAYSVAQRALEEDPSFRARVAERATIENVGEAGYLWLHRPAGWEQRFSDLNAGVESIDGISRFETPLAQRPPMPAVPTADQSTVDSSAPQTSAFAPVPADSTPMQPTPATQLPDGQNVADAGSEPAEAPVEAPRAPEPVRTSSVSSTVSSIEDELSSLKGLVDRLADERQNVRSSVTELEVELETRRAENLEMSTKLSSLRVELTTVQSTESTVLLERDRALARVADLEAEVARLATEVERMAAEAEGSSSEHEAALTDLAGVTSERDELRRELDAAKTEHEASLADLLTIRSDRDELAEAATERDSLQGELDAVVTDRNALTAQYSDIRSERDQIQDQLESVTADRDELRGQLESAEAERDELRGQLDSADAERLGMAGRLTQMDQVSSDNAELASRLSVAEQARVDLEGQLEDVSEKWKGATRQLSIFENVNSQLDAAVAERDALEAQLSRTNDALADLDGRIGTSHDQIRRELAGIETAFGDVPAPVSPVTDASAPAADATDSTVADATDASLDAATVAEGFESSDASTLAGATRDSTTPDLSTPEFDAPEVSSPEFDAPEFDAAEIETPDLGGVDDLHAPSFGDAVDLDTEGFASSDTDTDTDTDDDETDDDLFDGEGIAFDPAALGGRTIGDMFGGGDEDFPPSDLEMPISDLENQANGNGTADAFPGSDESVSDEPDVDQPDLAQPVLDRSTTDDDEVSTTGRRQLQVPVGLDDAAFAQHVVASPDIVLLIDGDGAAGLGWPHLDVATRRGALVDYLGTLTADTGAAADVVFARPVGDEDALPVSRAVRVRIADAAVADSSIFESIVNGYPQEWPIAIVTNEPTLIAQQEMLEVSVLSNDQLLDLFLELNSEG